MSCRRLRDGIRFGTADDGEAEERVLAIAVFGTTISGRELAIVGVVIVVIVAAIWFFARRRR